MNIRVKTMNISLISVNIRIFHEYKGFVYKPYIHEYKAYIHEYQAYIHEYNPYIHEYKGRV